MIVLVIALAAIGVAIFAALQLSQPAPQPSLEPMETVEVTQKPAPTATATDSEPEMLPNMKTLYEQNDDLAGWIQIEGTEVDYPVMYTPEDGEFYLYRNFEKEDDPTKEGCIFIDKNCTIDPKHQSAAPRPQHEKRHHVPHPD